MMVVVNMVWLRTFASTCVQKPRDCVGMDLVGVFLASLEKRFCLS
jgi:hypothetical protein